MNLRALPAATVCPWCCLLTAVPRDMTLLQRNVSLTGSHHSPGGQKAPSDIDSPRPSEPSLLSTVPLATLRETEPRTPLPPTLVCVSQSLLHQSLSQPLVLCHLIRPQMLFSLPQSLSSFSLHLQTCPLCPAEMPLRNTHPPSALCFSRNHSTSLPLPGSPLKGPIP